MEQLKALVFDAYGTVFNVHAVIETAEALFPGQGTPLSQLWRRKQLEYSWLRSLMRRHADFNAVTREALEYACEAMKLPYSPLAVERLNEAYRSLDPFVDAREAIPILHEKRRLAILSNGAPDMLHAVVAASGLQPYFNDVLSAEAAGIFKPDPRVYQLAVDRLSISAPEIGFVSSNGWDAAGARAFGFQVFWINRTGDPVDRLGLEPNHILSSLTELVPLLR
jgi:2-haloacid dehalogenase